VASRPSSLPEWLRANGVVAIDGVDTRRLTKHIRERGSLRCVVSTTDGDAHSLVAKARAALPTDGRDLASEVSVKEPYTWTEGYQGSYPGIVPPIGDKRRVRLVAYDFGIKRNILRLPAHTHGFDVDRRATRLDPGHRRAGPRSRRHLPVERPR
jgi:carbamoyl-phosphate synthase small subunit